MNLTKSFPRSPKTKMCGLVMLPRVIDKARAFHNKLLGDYIFPCPLDKIILNFLNTSHNEIVRLANQMTDEEMTLWTNKCCSKKTLKDKERVNQKILERKPDSQEGLARFIFLRDSISKNRSEITTWVDLIELDEN